MVAGCSGAPTVDAGTDTDGSVRLDAGSDGGALDAGTDAPGTDAPLEDVGMLDGGATDGGSDAGTDAGVDGGTDAGPDAGALPCMASVTEIGLLAEQIGGPAVAHHAGGTTLVTWADFERSTVPGVLRAADGTLIELGDLSRRTSTSPRPFSRPTAVSTSTGFTVLWIEQYFESGFMRFQARTVAVQADGAIGSTTTFTPGYEIRYTDVEPRLFGVGSDAVLVYRGRTTAPIPEARLVFRSLGSGASWDLPGGSPENVAWTGSEFSVATREGSAVILRNFGLDGTERLPAISVPRPTMAMGPMRLAASADGWTVLDADRAMRVSAAGAIVGTPIEVSRVSSVVQGEGESLLLGRTDAGQATAWRLGDDGLGVLELGFHGVRTTLELQPDGAAWTGTQWVAAFADRPADMQSHLLVLCDPR